MKELGSRRTYTAKQCELQLNILGDERQVDPKDPGRGSSTTNAPALPPPSLPPPRLPHLSPSQRTMCPEHEQTRRIAPAAGPRARARVTQA